MKYVATAFLIRGLFVKALVSYATRSLGHRRR
jgi:hypothetical protein